MNALTAPPAARDRDPRRGSGTAAAPGSRGNPLAGTGTLIRFTLRRDRIRIPVWIVAVWVTAAGFVQTFAEAFPTNEDIAERTAMLHGNPAGVLLTGPGYGLEDVSVDNYGPMVANELGATVIVLFALMSLLLTVRYTRAEEESGRAELVRAGAVGRHAALVVVGGMNLLLGALIALGIYAQDFPWEGSLAFGASMALLGIVVATIAAACAQITEGGRAAAGLAGAVFGVAFMVRGIGDMRDSGLTWASPVGWAQGMRPFAGEQWWPAAYLVGLAVLLAAVAYLLNARRDLGAALVRPRPGRARASLLLATPFALAFRLQRASLLWWAVVLMISGGGIGSLLAGEADTLAQMEVYQQVIDLDAGDLTAQFLAFYLVFMALVAAGFSLQSVLRGGVEEAAGRVEPVLAAAVARWRWAGSHLLVSLLGTAAILAATGAAMGLAVVAETQDSAEIWRYTEAALAYFPALGVLIGLAFALFGLLPRAAGLSWALLAYAVVVMMFAPFLELPDWALDISPFAHVPQLPAEELSAGPLLWLSGVALALIAAGFWGFRRRDLQAN